MTIEVHLKQQSNPVRCLGVKNAYQKGGLYCVLYDDGKVDKFPIRDIFRVRESPS